MRRDVLLSVVLFTIYFAVMSAIVYLKTTTLSITTDTATLVNAICVVEKSVHLYYGLLILRPLCHILNCITFNLLLTILGTLTIALTGIIVFLFAKRVLKDGTTALLFQALYYLNPMVHGLNLFGIHSEAFMIFFVALGVYLIFKHEDKPLLGYLTIMIGGLFKETAIFPLAGVFLWRLVNKKTKRWELALVTTTAIGLTVLFLFFTSLPLRFIEGRYITSVADLMIDALFFITRKIVFLAFLVLTVPTGFLSLIDLTLALPDLLNIFGTAVFKAYTKFVIGYQYQAVPALMLILVSVLAFKRLEVKRPKLALISVLLIVAIADLWLSPIDFFYYLFGVHPVKFFVTYRFIVNDSCCMNAAYELTKIVNEVVPQGSKVLADDQLAPFLACKYRIKRAGLLVFHENAITAKLDPCMMVDYLGRRFREVEYFVNLPGLTQSIDLDPIYLKALCEKIWWGNKGYVCKLREDALARLKEVACGKEYGVTAYVFNPKGILAKRYHYMNVFINWGYLHYSEPSILQEIAPYLPPYASVLNIKELSSYVPLILGYLKEYPINASNFIVIFSSKIHIPMNSTYGFKVESDDGSILLIDGKVIIDCWGPGTCSKEAFVTLKEGFHNLTLLYRNYGGAAMVKLYWKPPYACKEEPLPASYLYPLNVKPQGALVVGKNVTTVGLVWRGNNVTLRAEVCLNESATIDVVGRANVLVDGKVTASISKGCHVVEATGDNFEVRVRTQEGRVLPLIYPFSKVPG